MATKTIFKTFYTTLFTICSMHVFADVQTDHLITQSVKAKIASDPSVSSANILIKTTDGVVILNGLVDTQAQKDTALKVAGSIQSVLKVESNIAVRNIPEKTDSKNTQAPVDTRAASSTSDTSTNTQGADNTSIVTQQLTQPDPTAKASKPAGVPPSPDPNYKPPRASTFGATSNQSP